MGLKFFFTLIILSGISLSVLAQDTLKTPVIVHRIDSTADKTPAVVRSADTVAAASSPVDTINVKQHSPLRAGLASVILPGAGQFYNKKYWKIPIIYVGAAVDIYFIISNYNLYQTYRTAYIASINNAPNPYAAIYSDPELLSIQQYYQKYYNLAIIIGVAIYAINILDAVVDAHLFYYDISDKLSMNVSPIINPLSANALAGGGKAGLSLRLNF